MSKLYRLLVVAIVLGWLLARPTSVSACSCDLPASPADALTRADAVFIGTMTEMIDSKDSYGRRVSFEVSSSWKGVTTTQVVLYTGYGGGDCGYEFVPGSQYVVYAHRGESYPDQDSDSLATGICTRTNNTASAADDLTYLQALPQLNLTPASTPAPTPLLPCFGIVVVAGGLPVILRRRIRRRSGPA